jgi:tRNA (cmo5U34)-methyltransferase
MTMQETKKSRDTLYRLGNCTDSFTFNDKVAEVFDDMVNRSVPLYGTVIDAITRLLNHHFSGSLTLYDLGCSTGTTLLELSRRLNHDPLTMIGIDNAPPMLAKARRKAGLYRRTGSLVFQKGDITTCSIEDANAILCNYTLQFVRPQVRAQVVRRIYEALPPGGLFILCEKVLAKGAFQHPFIEIYHDFKRDQGYSELEIAAKREALENVLIPFTVDDNLALLEKAGFAEVEIFCRWFNFAALVALKKR